MSTFLIIFYLLSAVTLGTAFMTIYSKNPIHSAIYLVVCFFTIAFHFLLLNSQFLAIVQIIVYSGAIMVLFLFTIMLMNLNKENEVHKPRITRLGAIVSFVSICVILVLIFTNAVPFIAEYDVSGTDYQSIEKLGIVLLDDKVGFMVPFEYASILLLVAMIGTVLLSKKEEKVVKTNNLEQ